MSANHLKRGVAAERLAAEYLEARGLEVVARNLRCRAGELDLVCLDAEVLIVVEVRQRASAAFGGAPASVTWRKQRKIIRAVEFMLLRQQRWHRYAIRFDVLAVNGIPGNEVSIMWIKDAFRLT